MWFLPIRSLSVGWEQHVSESSNHTWTSVLWVYPDISKKQLSCNSQCLSHFIALFIVVENETRNDSDNDTLIEDGSGMCWTSGPPGMSDHGPSKKHRKSGYVLRAVGSGKSLCLSFSACCGGGGCCGALLCVCGACYVCVVGVVCGCVWCGVVVLWGGVGWGGVGWGVG